MKRIAIFCDGTWNGAEGDWPTNVKILGYAAAMKSSAYQQVSYFKGVGVPEGGTWLERLNEKISGGAMGWGLDAKIALAYVALAKAYEPGDQVFIFGFSRGAYTARSLVGLIRYSGIPASTAKSVIDACFENYRGQNRGEAPPTGRSLADTDHNLAFRARLSPHVATSAFERDWRVKSGEQPLPLFSVAYLGVWDTVGALGIPSYWGLPARILNRKYRFHNTDLSSLVLSARHAVSIDERRRPFEPTLWTNLDTLAAEGGDYRQEWFAGDHGSVGGGGDIEGLSSITLSWIAEGARAAGLEFDGARMDEASAPCDPFAKLRNRSATPTLAERVMSITSRWRRGPTTASDVSHPVKSRWLKKRDYRPKPLLTVAGDLDQTPLADLRDYRWTAGLA
ncbi:DUF2235 domain-containing protein [Frigidibacter sp. RF13]|uniref:DUF2235 domain-containing protein n=1 Tax=Frigidibacter sp. RF13 TaxID=2997340 RepID=UPI002270078D|nr:DUF2235 domain-containing protein [Frigidibacter sp. RF13]MCY1125488.1 DUF2235 domain-containing protein [Frigidibacter sp. RF13]